MSRLSADRCPLCRTSAGAIRNQPVSDDPAVLETILEALRGWLDRLRRGEVSPPRVPAEVPNLCAACRGMLGGIVGDASHAELVQHLTLSVRKLEAQLDAIGQDQTPTGEPPSRRRAV